MTLRRKLLLVFAAFGFAPLVALAIYGLLSGTEAVEELLRERTGDRVARAAARVERDLDEIESRLLRCAGEESARDFVGRAPAGPAGARGAYAERVADFFLINRRYLESLTVYDASGSPLLRASADPADPDGVRLQTENFASSERRAAGQGGRRPGGGAPRSLTEEPYGAALRMDAPVGDAGALPAPGALVAEIKLGQVFADADEGGDLALLGEAGPHTARAPAAAGAARRELIALVNQTGTILYHTNDALKHRPVADAMPYFGGVAAKMTAGGAGFDYYAAPGGGRWLAAYAQARTLPVSLAAAADYTGATAGARRRGVWGIAAALAAAGAGVIFLLAVTGRAAQNIGRVVEGASAIAAGDLGRRIEVRSSDEMRGLAESLNLMSDRLEELIRREAEARQFESFTRLSAMLTHDLKNAITGLSMLVANMERQYHREEFRADAVASLREAADKLRRIVGRLNEPMISVSGEYRRNMRPVDLVPILRRVLAANAEPHRDLYRIEARLPDSLVAAAEPRRIETVFENLVINAVEAMGARGGRLTVEAGAEGDRHVFVSVSDTGAGMSEGFVRTRLFHPFATTKAKGIGLGLYTVREIVETHGGRVEVESELGAGTRFRVVLPSRPFSSTERC